MTRGKGECPICGKKGLEYIAIKEGKEYWKCVLCDNTGHDWWIFEIPETKGKTPARDIAMKITTTADEVKIAIEKKTNPMNKNLTKEERQSFRKYAKSCLTEPDGTRCQWANYTIRLLNELDRLKSNT
jgi:phage/plasmid primase-like uncharacterized protein